jgi:hypothetical protein
MAARESGPRALTMAGLTHADIDLCMIYDSFTITVLLTLENLGFCKKGEGGAFVQGGRLGLGGALPINTDGGGLSSNHPGMRGIFLVIEAVKQLRGECGERQIADCEVALCHGTGGMLGLRHSGVRCCWARMSGEIRAAAAHRRRVKGLGGLPFGCTCRNAVCGRCATTARCPRVCRRPSTYGRAGQRVHLHVTR